VIRDMTLKDIELLNLPAEWMRDRYKMFLENEVGPGWVIEDEQGPLCAVGVAFLWDGVCEVWFNLIRKTKCIAVVRALNVLMYKVQKNYNIRRMHATISCQAEAAQKFAKFFGFERETPDRMKKYNPDGSDAYLYSRIFRAAQIAQMSARGGRITGSNLLLLTDTAREFEADAGMIMYNYQLKATQLRTAGAIARYQGQVARRASRIRATADILGGAGKMYMMGRKPGGGYTSSQAARGAGAYGGTMGGGPTGGGSRSMIG